MTLPDRVQLNTSFSQPDLLADLETIENLDWISHFVTSNYEGDWDVLPLRGPTGAEHPVMMVYSDPSCEKFTDTPFLKEGAYFQQVLASFPFELHAVRLMALSPGSRIKEHKDHDLSLEDGTIRLHIPVRTSESVEFLLNGSRVHMAEGECWYLRLSDSHSVYNGSQISRVHMVIDAPVNKAVIAYLNSQIDSKQLSNNKTNL